jgi:hypothetical protein
MRASWSQLAPIGAQYLDTQVLPSRLPQSYGSIRVRFARLSNAARDAEQCLEPATRQPRRPSCWIPAPQGDRWAAPAVDRVVGRGRRATVPRRRDAGGGDYGRTAAAVRVLRSYSPFPPVGTTTWPAPLAFSVRHTKRWRPTLAAEVGLSRSLPDSSFTSSSTQRPPLTG